MTLGYNKPLYILPFDHRGSFQTGHVRLEGHLEPGADGADRRRQAGDLRRLQGRRRGGVPKERAGILVDEQFGAAILQDAAQDGLYHRRSRGEKWAGRVRLRVWRGLRHAHRGLQPDLLQGPGALQPRGRQGHERSARPSGCGSCPSICTRTIASTCSSCSSRPRQTNSSRSVGTASATTSSGAPP